MVFISDPLLKAAQEFLLYSRVFFFFVCATEQWRNQSKKNCVAGRLPALSLPLTRPRRLYELPADSIKLAANNAGSNISNRLKSFYWLDHAADRLAAETQERLFLFTGVLEGRGGNDGRAYQ